MTPWPESLTAALSAVPPDVDTKAVRKVFNRLFKEWAKTRQPVQAVQRGYEIPVLLNTPAFLEAWDMYERHRMEKRKKLTPLAARQQLKSLDAMGVERAIAAIHYSVGNGWTGIFEPKQQGNTMGNGIPLFKQIEIVKEAQKNHPCYSNSRAYDPNATEDQHREYRDIKAKLQSLEQEQRKRVVG